MTRTVGSPSGAHVFAAADFHTGYLSRALTYIVFRLAPLLALQAEGISAHMLIANKPVNASCSLRTSVQA